MHRRFIFRGACDIERTDAADIRALAGGVLSIRKKGILKLIACMPVRNEAWVLGFSIRVALLWCDELVILNHASTDRTVDIMQDLLYEFAPRVHLISVPGLQWNEMQHRQMMLEQARRRGATHIAIVDADEVLTGNLLESLDGGTWRSEMRHGIANGCICQLPGYNLRGSLNRYHANGIWGNRWFSVAFKDAPDLGWSGDKFHHREPGPRKLNAYRPIQHGQGGVLHLWGSSERRLVARHALYKVTERLRWPQKPIAEIERMYNWAIKGDQNVASYGTPATWTYADVPEAWLAPYKNLLQYLDIDATPWQENETRRLVHEHGREAFRGLDLFGVA